MVVPNILHALVNLLLHLVRLVQVGVLTLHHLKQVLVLGVQQLVLLHILSLLLLFLELHAGQLGQKTLGVVHHLHIELLLERTAPIWDEVVPLLGEHVLHGLIEIELLRILDKAS